MIHQTVAHYRTPGASHEDLLPAMISACKCEDEPRSALHDQVIAILPGGIESTASTIVRTL